ncbi:MAG: fibronectin type III domain-containing protein [Candidatus Pacebacteria bacterium]|nr:fibronectin type III domain-containing protein [Candidatus Paceibacterota bacterium]
MSISRRLKSLSRTPGIFSFLIIFSVILLGLFCFSQTAQAFSCDSGDLNTTCYVSTAHVLSDGETISGSGNLVIQDGGNLLGTTTAAGTASTSFSINMTGDVTIQASGTITTNVNLTAANLTIDAGGSINVNERGYKGGIKGNGAGPGGGEGTSTIQWPGAGGGAGYGGNGGIGGNAFPGYVFAGGDGYGSTTQPIDLGSGGGGDFGDSGYGNGGYGGGAVKISLTGILTINGSITANASSGIYSAWATGGGGAGGSIWITAGTISGSSTITANGGNGAYSGNGDYGGGGAGGRIAVYYTTDSSNFTYRAFGGTSSGFKGGAGAIFLKAAAATYGDLSIDNNNISGASTTLPTSTVITLDNLIVRRSANYFAPSTTIINIANTVNGSSSGAATIDGTISFPSTATIYGGTLIINGTSSGVTNLTVTSSASVISNPTASWPDLTDLTIASSTFYSNQSTTTPLTLNNVTVKNLGNLTHSTHSAAHLYSINLIVNNDLTIESGGFINVNERGYAGGVRASGSGPGGGNGTSTLSCCASGGGGAYGGNGGSGASCGGGVGYGSTTQPIDLGSGGGGDYGDSSYGNGGAGGGAIKISVTGTFTNNGSITANATSGILSGWANGGGGAGGSIWITAGTLLGNGTTTANGGNGAYAYNGDYAGGGGGGRIAVYYATDSSSFIYQAFGGTSSGYKGGAGTIFLKSTAANGNLIIDNNGTAGASTTQATSSSLTVDNLIIRNSAIYYIPTTTVISLVNGFASGTANAYLTNNGSINLPSGAINMSGVPITVVNGGIMNNASSTFTVSTTTFTNNGIINDVTNLIVTSSSVFYQNGTFSAGLTDLTISSSTFEYQNTNTSTVITLNTLTINNKGVLTHTANTTSSLHALNLLVSDLDIQPGGYINVNGKGYAGGSDSGNGYGPGSGSGYSGSGSSSIGGGGGSHGGDGGKGNYLTTEVAAGLSYGSTTVPIDLGSGGGSGKYGAWSAGAGGAGGGIVELNVTGTLTLNGFITANGSDGAKTSSYGEGGGGSGGSIYITVNTLTGNGTTTANGGNGAGSYSGAGGGGRIAIYYTTDNSSTTKQAFGGGTTGYRKGGAGAIFLTTTGAPNGDLIIDNNNTSACTTTQATSTSFTVNHITVKNGGIYYIPTATTLSLVSGFASGTANAYLTVGGTLSLPTGATDISGASSIINNGIITNSSASFTFSSTTLTNNGSIENITNLIVTSSATFYQNGTLTAGLTDLTISSSTFEFQNLSTTTSFSLNNLTIKNKGILTHTANTTSSNYALNLIITNLDVQLGGYINVNGKGYAGGSDGGNGSGPGAGSGYSGSGSSSLGGGGGGYGGNGGYGNYLTTIVAGGLPYGSTTVPIDLGSGGGSGKYGGNPAGAGGAGGGIVELNVTGTLTLNGFIVANGSDGAKTGSYGDGGGGSGGSIYITVNALVGGGTTTANGGNGSASGYAGAGGGGRIAIHYTTDNSLTTKQAFGGGTTGYQKGGAGTIFTKSSTDILGSLMMDNNNVAGASTTQPSGSSLVLGSIVVRNAAYYLIPSDATLIIATSSVSVSSTANGLLINNGTLITPSSFTINNLTLNNNGAISTLTNLTVASSTFYQNGSIPSLTDLTLEASSTFEYQNLSTVTSATLSNLTIQNGGALTHTVNNSTQIYSLNLVINNNLDIQSGGSISVSGKGYGGGVLGSNGNGYGAGLGWYSSGTSKGAGGGGYGGAGANGNATTGGPVYGNSIQPTDLGSGGGSARYNDSYYGYGGGGGGFVKIVNSGTTTINGSLISNGSNGTRSSSNFMDGGGGSGGSIYLITNVLSGNGTTSANGGDAGGGYGGGGGGGRIAIYYTTKTYSGVITVNGGTGYATGATGSITEDGTPPVSTSTPLCTIVGNSCTAYGSSSSPQWVYDLQTLSGTASDTESGLTKVELSIKDTTTNLWYDNSLNTFSTGTEVWFQPTGTTTWSHNASTIPWTRDHVYQLKSKATNGGDVAESSPGTLTFKYAYSNYPPIISNASSTQATSGVVSTSFDITDYEQTTSTIQYFTYIGTYLTDDLANDATTSLTVNDTTYLPTSSVVLIDNEIINYASSTTTTLNDLTRAASSTTAATHASGTSVWIKYLNTSGDLGSTTNANDKLITWTPGTLLSGFYSTTSQIKIYADDNTGTSTSVSSSAHTITLDFKGPVISSINAGSINTSTATVTWTTDEGGDSYVVYSTTSGFTSGTRTGSGAATTSHSVALSSLASGATYYYKVTSKDSLSNNSTSSEQNFATLNQAGSLSNVVVSQTSTGQVVVTYDIADPDSTTSLVYLFFDVGITLSDTLTATNTTSMTVSDTSNIATSGVIMLGDEIISYTSKSTSTLDNLTRAASSTEAATHNSGLVVWLDNLTVTTEAGVVNGTDQSITWNIQDDFTGLDSSTTKIQVVALDDSNNLTKQESSVFNVDTQDPTVSTTTLTATSVTYQSAVVTWTTDESSNSYVVYSTTSGFTSGTLVGQNESATSHSVTISSLTGDTTYYYKAVSSDSYSNQGTSTEQSFTTLSAPVTQATSTPASTLMVIPPAPPPPEPPPPPEEQPETPPVELDQGHQDNNNQGSDQGHNNQGGNNQAEQSETPPSEEPSNPPSGNGAPVQPPSPPPTAPPPANNHRTLFDSINEGLQQTAQELSQAVNAVSSGVQGLVELVRQPFKQEGSSGPSEAASTSASSSSPLEVIKNVINNVKRFIRTPLGLLSTRAISTVGVTAGLGMMISNLFVNPISLSEFFLLPLRLWAVVLMMLGLKKRKRPWGVVYDSQTKQPLDPAYVVLKDASGKEVGDSFTDLDGRYGFFTQPGSYLLEANKTNYQFPSQKLLGQTKDVIYDNLYFGEATQIAQAGEVITKNIPMDPVKFDWNEFAKRDQKLMKFHSKLDIMLNSKLARILFGLGFVVSIIALWAAPYPYNLIIFGLYVLLLILRKLGLKPKTLGRVLDLNTGTPLSFAILRIISPAENKEMFQRVCDQLGRYYCLVPPGKYYIKIERKDQDGSYLPVFTSPLIDAANGIIDRQFGV